VSAKLFVLVPPSEAKSTGGSHTSRVGSFDDGLQIPRRIVVGALRELLLSAPAPLLERTLNVRGPLLDRALKSLAAVVEGRALLKPAWKRYTGVVWSHLDASSMTPGQRRQILIPSGLYGLTTAMDPVAEYRLKMDVGLAPLGTMAKFWRPILAPVLAEHVGRATMVNLLPSQHSGALNFDVLAQHSRIVNVDFIAANGSRAAGHAAKAVKGVLARRLIDHGLHALSDFEWEGWSRDRRGGEIRILAPSDS
jgi:cytoplasmic iron level regulating protein YaaA (DUF328/UPF0246 family)